MSVAQSIVEVAPPLTPILDEGTQFVAPRAAWEAIDVPAIMLRALADGVECPRIDVTLSQSRFGVVRFSCSAAMTLRLVTAWNTASDRARRREDARLEEAIAYAIVDAVQAVRSTMLRSERLDEPRFGARSPIGPARAASCGDGQPKIDPYVD